MLTRQPARIGALFGAFLAGLLLLLFSLFLGARGTEIAAATGPDAEFAIGPDEARLRVAHLAPFSSSLAGTEVDVRINGADVITEFAYLESTTYLTLTPAVYTVEVALTGEITAQLSVTVELAAGVDYTAIACGGANGWDLALAALVDDNTLPPDGFGAVRFGHLAPFAAAAVSTTADIRLDSGKPVITDVVYGDIAATYLQLAAGEYDLEVTTPGGGDVLIDIAPFTLNSGDILYALAVGDGSNQGLGVFAYPTDVMGFLLDPDVAQLRVAHLAPFAAADTEVDIALNGTPVLTGVAYLSSTTYLTLDEGDYLVEVFPTGEATPVLTAPVSLMGATDYTAIAHGGANEWDLALAALVDDNTPPKGDVGKVRFGHLAPFAASAAATLADIRLDDGTPVLTDVAYADIAATYMELPAGVYDLEITTPGGGVVLIDVAPFTLNAGDILYALAVGDGTDQALDVFAYPADAEGILLGTEGEGRLRVAHLAPFASNPAFTAVDVTLDGPADGGLNGTTIITDFQYLNSTTYIDLEPGEYVVGIRPAAGIPGIVVGDITTTVTVVANQDYTAIAYGGPLLYPLELVVLEDDNSVPAGFGKIRFGHLAPFSPIQADTLADIRLDDGTPIITDVLYSEIAGTYLQLSAGTYDLQITTPGGKDVLFDAAPFALADGDVLYAFAVGDGKLQDVGVFVYVADQLGFLLPEDGFILLMPIIPNS